MDALFVLTHVGPVNSLRISGFIALYFEMASTRIVNNENITRNIRRDFFGSVEYISNDR